MRTIRIPNATLQADVRGTRPQAVFVHGLGDDLSTWDTLWAEFNKRMTPSPDLLRYDLRGFGNSIALSDAPYNHADDLLAILDANAIEQCDLVGISMGGSIALNFALDHPERVRSLVLISPGMVAWEWSDAWRVLWEPITQHARSGAMDEARRLWWMHPLFSTTRDTPAGAALHASIMRYSGNQWVHDSHQLMLPDIERLHQLATRTLLLTGEKDFEDFRLIADLIEGSANNVQRNDYSELGHLLNLEDPDECARQIVAFWDAAAATH
jgi:pimeloyl-ACP methyl ester carboxylesterase